MDQNSQNDTEKRNENSRIYVLFYSFFLIPFMIAVFGAVFFLLLCFALVSLPRLAEILPFEIPPRSFAIFLFEKY